MVMSSLVDRSSMDSSVTIHVAVGMLVRPVTFSNTIQSILNSDPASGGPDVATLARSEFGGTASSNVKSDNQQ